MKKFLFKYTVVVKSLCSMQTNYLYLHSPPFLMHKAIFLDKDGTLVDNSGYPQEIPSDILLEDEVLDGLYFLQQRGFKLIIISNQSWIAKGRLSKKEVEDIFRSVVQRLESLGITLHGYYYCPHKASDECSCRKPNIGLFLRAAQEHGIQLEQSFMIGDMEDDILAGKNAGVKTVLVRTGRGKDFNSSAVTPNHVIENLNGISEVLEAIERSKNEKGNT